eukprot:6198821-Pleurochrysis_carterae.AAC.1
MSQGFCACRSAFNLQNDLSRHVELKLKLVLMRQLSADALPQAKVLNICSCKLRRITKIQPLMGLNFAQGSSSGNIIIVFIVLIVIMSFQLLESTGTMLGSKFQQLFILRAPNTPYAGIVLQLSRVSHSSAW